LASSAIDRPREQGCPAHEPPPAEEGGGHPRRRLLAAALFCLAAAVASITADDPGLTWDEAIYFGYALGYRRWFDRPAFDEASLARAWGGARLEPDTGRRRWIFPGQVHPPLGKLWIAAWFGLLGVGVSAARIGTALLFGAATAAVYLWSAKRRGERAGWLASAAFLLMPRLFAHGHIASLEMPTLLLWFLAAIAFEAGIRRRAWSVACGLLFGLAMLTRATALFLPLVLWPWGLLFHGRKALRNIVAMAVLGPALFLAGWPALWPAPCANLAAWLRYWSGADGTARTLVPVFYLGERWAKDPAPWHYPFVMLFVTTPLPILGAAAWHIATLLRRLAEQWRALGHEALLLGAGAFPVILPALPGAPRYDGIRLMLPAMPFLATAAGYGAEAAWTRLRPRLRRPRAAGVAAGALLLAWLLAPVLALHPFQLCYYNELVGGPWGARRLGFETTYWNDTLTDDVLEWVRSETPPGGRVARVAVGDFVWKWHTGLGALAAGERGPAPLDGDFASGDWDTLIVIPRQGYWTDEVRRFVATHRPARAWFLPPAGRLPVCLVYRKARPAAPRDGSRRLPREGARAAGRSRSAGS